MCQLAAKVTRPEIWNVRLWDGEASHRLRVSHMKIVAVSCRGGLQDQGKKDRETTQAPSLKTVEAAVSYSVQDGHGTRNRRSERDTWNAVKTALFLA